jgi:hypothetical protein
MATPYQHLKRYQNFFGVNLKSNDLDTPDDFSTDLLNVQMRRNGTLEKRKGHQGHADSDGGLGLFVYNRSDRVTGVQEAIVLSASDTLKKLETATLSITYSGSEASAVVNVIYDTTGSQYVLTLQAGPNPEHTISLGTAVDNASPVTITSLVAAINLYASGFAASVSGSGTTPAAFLSTVINYDIVGSGALSVSAKYWSTVPGPLAAPFAGAYAKRNEDYFELISSTELQNCIYLSSGYDEVMKYDGQKVYRAGVPTPELNQPFTSSGAGTNYEYIVRFVQGDAVFNEIEGNLAYSDTVVNTFPAAVTVSVDNLAASTGFNATGAIISASAGPTRTISVSSGHTLIAGDRIYFWDNGSGQFVTRTLVSTTFNSVTFDSSEAQVTVVNTGTDNKNVISNNLRIAIYRNTFGSGLAGLFYEVVQIPNNPFAATSTWQDVTPDTTLELQRELEIPLTDRSPPEKGKYVSSFQGLMVTAGDISSPNNVSFSDIENPEYFPIPDNQISINNLIGDQITGIAPANENFIIFQNRSIHAVTGDVPEQNFRVDLITRDIGCVAHATIQEVRGVLFFLSKIGPRFIQGAQIPQAIGGEQGNSLISRIDPLFEQVGMDETMQFKLKRSIGFNDTLGEKYWLFLPVEETKSGNIVNTSDSQILIFDYSRGSWLIWNNKDIGSGVIAVGEEIYWQTKRLDALTSSVKKYLYRQSTVQDSQAYHDDGQAISAYYKSPWEFLGEAGVLKSFKAIRVYGVEDLDSPFELQITTERDWIRDAPLSECSLTFGIGGYGASEYGSGPYGDPSTTALKHPLSNGRVYALRVTFENEENLINFALTGYELEIATNYKVEFKS